ncbi:mast cell protease 1A-like [Pholidichthys leucotaenia]
MHALRVPVIFCVLTCLGQNARASEIVNGKKVPEKSMPYMASVQNDNRHVCGGFLVSEQFVITAAHCDKANPTNVVLGTHNLKKVNNKTMRYSVTRCKYPGFKKAESGDDIMLLKLTKKAHLSERVKPIKLPKTTIKIKDNENCDVAGWGYTENNGKAVDELNMATVPHVNLDTCKKEWKEAVRKFSLDLPNNITCAGKFDTKQGFCQGDSGGPLVCRGLAVGVVSFNRKCDYPNLPNVYTDVTKYLGWITNILNKKQC